MASVEARRGFQQEFDYDGRPNQKLVCRFPDPTQRQTFSNGRAVEHYPLLIVSSHNPSRAECVEVAGFVPDNARGTSVNREMCKLQIECGLCPRGLKTEDLNRLA